MLSSAVPVVGPSGRRRGFTLVEVIVAVTLTSLLMLAVSRLVRHACTLEGDMSRRSALHAQHDALVQTLEQDLQNLFVDESAPNPFEPPPAEPHVKLRFKTTNRLNVGSLYEAQRWPVEVTYRLVESGPEDGLMSLVREERDLTVPQSTPPYALVVAERLSELVVQLIHDEPSRGRLESRSESAALPRAIKLTATFAADPPAVVHKTVLLNVPRDKDGANIAGKR